MAPHRACGATFGELRTVFLTEISDLLEKTMRLCMSDGK